MRTWFSFGVGVVGLFTVSTAAAEPAALIAASDPASLSEVELVQVAASPRPLWLRARVAAHAKLALVSGANETDAAPNASAWLGALDFATRVRVTPPPGPLAPCTGVSGKLADSGAPEPALLDPSSVATLSSELDLRRALSDAGLSVDAGELVAFTGAVLAPYRVSFFESGAKPADTATIRLTSTGPALTVPGLVLAPRTCVPATVLTLAAQGLEPALASSFEPGNFAVTYFGATATTNYVSARAAWSNEDPARWLDEARAASALFDFTVIPGAGEIEPGASDYFERVLGLARGRACFDAVLAARSGGSGSGSDFGCGGADDLEIAQSAVNFGDLRITRLFGTLSRSDLVLRVSGDAPHDSRVVATDFDGAGCGAPASPPNMSGGTGAVTESCSGSSESSSGSGRSGPGIVEVSSPDEPSIVTNNDSCGVTVYPDSCSGDSSTSSSDSCSGDSTSSDATSSDSCSGDSTSSDATSSDSCSGDSSSSDDSSGCGSSGYQGDTCSGSTENSASVEKSSAALQGSSKHKTSAPRAKKLHLSLLTLFSAALAFPLRRRGSKFDAHP